MADYYPLLSRAVAGLNDPTPALRNTLYDRARKALISQLESAVPALDPAHIERERAALEAAIARVEIEATTARAAPPDDPPLANARRAPEPRAETIRERDTADTAGADADGDPVEAPVERARPRAPGPPKARVDRSRIVIVAGVTLVAVAGVATAAILFREDPAKFQPIEDAAPQGPVRDADRKLGGRLGEQLSATPESARGAARSPGEPILQVAQRALLLVEPPAGAVQPIGIAGRALWRVEEIATGQGRPLETAFIGEVDIPEARLRLTMTILRNRDPALPASHTIELRFTSGGEAVKEAGVPLLKADETARGVPLSGVPAPVTDNFIIVGLSNLDADVTRNLDLLANRNWFEIPFRFADGKRAVLTIERGPSGERAFARAQERWR